jgi:multicomponent Na+:H+ antiporter subunit D
MNVLLVLPLVLPLLAAGASLLAWNRLALQRAIAVVATAALLVSGLLLLNAVAGGRILVTEIGNWPAPYGITLVADILSAVMVVLAGITGLAVAVFSLADIDKPRQAYGFFPLFHALLMGVCGAFLTGDLFNLYVWFEVMLMSSFVLLALGNEPNQLRGAIKYMTLNLLASAIFLAAVGITYGVAGTLNMADLAAKLRDGAGAGVDTTLAMLFLIAFGVKAAVFPLFFWLPASYHTPPVAISAIFAGLLTKVGVYALVRVFTLIFVQETTYTHTLLLIIAGLTMVTGVFGAASQFEFRRILSFHIISQIGYMLMGLALAGLTSDAALATAALAGSIFYIAHHIIVKTNLFLISGVVRHLRGTLELGELGGLYKSYPLLAFCFLIPAMSLSGMPPLSGFFAKLSLVRAGLAIDQYTIVGVALAVGLLTLYSMTKIWSEAFWKPAPEGVGAAVRPLSRSQWHSLVLPIVFLASITVGIGLFADPMFRLATSAAEQLMDRDSYIQTVLEKAP